MKHVALIHVINSRGHLLLGKRLDNGKWTMPGGGIDGGENAKQGAIRELYEETGLRPLTMTFSRKFDNGQDVTCHCFTALCVGEAKPHSENDPDKECSKWEWFDVSDGLKTNIWDALAGPKNPRYNAIKQVISKGK